MRYAFRQWLAPAFVCSASLGGGCDRSAPPPPVGAVGDSPATAAVVKWLDGAERESLEVRDEALSQALAAASAEARRTAPEAAISFNAATRRERETRWFIKWAVRIEPAGEPPPDGAERSEHLWVRPLTWSAHRVEGVLLTSPHEATIGKSPGDFVAFSTDELSDWARLLDDTLEGPRQGGFTLDVLERFIERGEPPMNSDGHR
jgi:uncharacterized protein YegJ (DUF2314 family)